nr:MAG TPA: hypothetical protein [Caudoviricetes sp.]
MKSLGVYLILTTQKSTLIYSCGVYQLLTVFI